MPDETEQDALSKIKAYLDSGHGFDAIRQAGWASWIDHLEAKGYDLRTGQLALRPPENELPRHTTPVPTPRSTRLTRAVKDKRVAIALLAVVLVAVVAIIAAVAMGGGGDEGPATAGDPTPTPVSPGEPAVKLPEYRIVEAEDASHKALEGLLSSYTSEELERLPLDKRFFYRIVVSNDVTTPQIRPLIDVIISDLTVRDGDLDEIVLFFYSDEGLIDSAFDIAKATWAPKGELGNITPLIASTNNRESYRTSVEIRENLEEYLRQRNEEETKFGLTEQQRRQFFKDLVAAEDRAQAEADRLFPLDDPLIPDYEENLTNNFDTFDRLADGYRSEVRDQYGVTQEQQSEISAEAFNEGWPLD